MFSSAASAILLSSVAYLPQRAGASEQDVWARMRSSFVTIMTSDERPIGAAVLIDSRGLFVAHRQAVQGDTVQARLSNGESVRLVVRTSETATQLVLLAADKWDPNYARPFRAPGDNERPGGLLLAVLGSGPIRAEFVSSRLHGVIRPSQRLVPLTELRFEAPEETIGSALIVCENGELLGGLNATLRSATPVNLGNQQSALSGLQDVRNLQDLVKALPKQGLRPQNSIGPSSMTVAYTVGPSFVRRVLDGFRSPDHRVIFPSLGVFCVDNVGGGALVQVVKEGSAADKAGVRVGDVLLDIAGNNIRNQVDFALVMLRQESGRKITMRVKRGLSILIMDAVVGRADLTQSPNAVRG